MLYFIRPTPVVRGRVGLLVESGVYSSTGRSKFLFLGVKILILESKLSFFGQKFSFIIQIFS